MPPRGVEHRSRQMAQLAGLSHQMFTDPAIGDLLAMLIGALAFALAFGVSTAILLSSR